MKQGLLSGVAVLAGLAAGPALAAVQSQAAVEAPQIIVTDLDPGDGIAPAWIEGGYRAPVFHADLHPAPVRDEASGDGTLDIQPQSVGGQADAPHSSYFAVRDLYLPSFTLRLTPFTRFTLQVPYRLDLSVDAPVGAVSMLPRAHASIELSLLAIDNLVALPGGTDFSYGGPYVDRDYIQLDSSTLTPAYGARWLDGVLSVQFDNLGAGEAVLAFRAELVAFGDSATPTAMPEAGTVALWLVGAGALAWRHKPRKPKTP